MSTLHRDSEFDKVMKILNEVEMALAKAKAAVHMAKQDEIRREKFESDNKINKINEIWMGSENE